MTYNLNYATKPLETFYMDTLDQSKLRGTNYYVAMATH